MATYKQIQDNVRSSHGFKAQTCWIAHVLSDYGLTTRVAHNRKTPMSARNPVQKARSVMR